MENLFDHNPTDEELITICGSLESAEYLKQCSEQTHIGKIVNLMACRGNKALVKKYLDMIDDPDMRFSTEYGLLQLA